MNQINEYLLTAVDTVVEEKIKQAPYDQTVIGEIVRVLSYKEKSYVVRYFDIDFIAYDTMERDYSSGDEVYVKIINGDWDQKKIIEGPTSVKIQDLSQQNKIKYQQVSPSIPVMFGAVLQGEKEIGLVRGDNKLGNGSLGTKTIYTIRDPIPENAIRNFKQYNQSYDLLMFKGEFKTNFNFIDYNGDYQVSLLFQDVNGGLLFYTFSSQNFIGDPYNFQDYTPQEFVVQVPKGLLEKFIGASFVERMPTYDTQIKDGEATSEYNTNIPNIFIKNFDCFFVKKEVEMDRISPYELKVISENGFIFTEEQTSLNIKAILYNQGKEYWEDSFKIYWYQENLNITGSSEGYSEIGGIKWELVQTGGDNFTAVSKKLPCQKYKVVVQYGERDYVEKIFTIDTPLVKDLYYMAKQVTDDEKDIFLYVRPYDNSADTSKLTVKWMIEYADKTYEQLTTDTSHTIMVTRILREKNYYGAAHIFAIVYNNRVEIGTYDTIISTYNPDGYAFLVNFKGPSAFKYDRKRQIDIDALNQDYQISPVITLTNEEEYPIYNVNWFDSSMNLISKKQDSPTILNSSMLENVYVDEYNNLCYNIKSRYDINNTNNSFIFEITTLDGKVYDFKKEIYFTKEGEPGSNGTNFYLDYSIENSEPGSMNRPLISYNMNGNLLARSKIKINAQIYKNDTLLDTSSSEYTFEYEWKLSSSLKFVDSPSSNSKFVFVTGKNLYTRDAHFVKLLVTIKGGDIPQNEQIKLTKIIPIHIVKLDEGESVGSIVYRIPSFVIYDSNGRNPESNNKNCFLRNTDGGTGILTSNNDLGQMESNGKMYTFHPNLIYLGEQQKDSAGVLIGKVYRISGEICFTIPLFLDTYQNENIDGWDGTSVEINNKNHYVFAPQVGAGKKTEQGFTGVIMGKDSERQQTGLYGYREGINTFGFESSGYGYIGAPGHGRISFEGKNAIIKGGDSETRNNMTLILSNEQLGTMNWEDTKAISVKDETGKDVFFVQYNGFLHSELGQVGGWFVNEDTLYAEGDKGRKTVLKSNGDVQLGGTFAINPPRYDTPMSVGAQDSQKTIIVDTTGIQFYKDKQPGDNTLPFINISYQNKAESTMDLPFIALGTGTNVEGAGRGMVKKYPGGLWVGDSDDINAEGNKPLLGVGLFANTSDEQSKNCEIRVPKGKVNKSRQYVFDNYGINFYTDDSSTISMNFSFGKSVAGGKPDMNLPYIGLGSGDQHGKGRGIIKKYYNGIWIGDSDDIDNVATVPSQGTGIFIDSSAGKIYKYIKGVKTQL